MNDINGYMQMMEDAANAAAALGGMRKQLIAQGFTEEQAGELVILMMTNAMEANNE